ncbi:hypothetical protein HN018_10370 [Lichenicola cladoniae]|uniref:Uncharacterized protein n=1 Tax=Lichenicola cladoniae TaxID=1484109 RepID=A0A6M8HPZ3_9PROT|nr:hypothetical protein [Lichenicola cladoniae]NPD66371.1 hypothetical protein [Acetobacteraceae bacterium]QKE90386.1 hypothetical protein HN018_10370 [Lichenicola cladoniae]
MTQPRTPPTTTPDRAEADRQSRLVREAAALRENLRRRKQQMRARQEPPPDTVEIDPGIVSD